MQQVKAKKALGQHFLTDLSIARRIADTLSGHTSLPVVEVGPGMGVLTQFLLADGLDLKVVELDGESVDYLNEKYPALHGNIIADDFLKLDIRVGKVLECQKVPKADKLLQFKIDDGMGGRTIVSGIAKYYAPEDLVGKEVCFIANFAPRRLKGVESQGMILSAENADGSLVVIGPQGEVHPGCQVK